MEIMPYEEFRQLPPEEQSKVLTNLREQYSNNIIMKAWNLNNSNYYRLVHQLDVPMYKPKEVWKMIKRGHKWKTANDNEADTTRDSQPASNDLPRFSIQLTGTYDAEKLKQKLEMLASMLDPKGRYNITLDLNEVK